MGCDDSPCCWYASMPASGDTCRRRDDRLARPKLLIGPLPPVSSAADGPPPREFLIWAVPRAALRPCCSPMAARCASARDGHGWFCGAGSTAGQIWRRLHAPPCAGPARDMTLPGVHRLQPSQQAMTGGDGPMAQARTAGCVASPGTDCYSCDVLCDKSGERLKAAGPQQAGAAFYK